MASRSGPYVLIRTLLLLVAMLVVVTKAGRVYNFSALGGVAGDMSESVASKMELCLILLYKTTTERWLFFQYDYHDGYCMGPDATICLMVHSFFKESGKLAEAPCNKARVLDCMHFYNCNNMILRLLEKDWSMAKAQVRGIPGIGYLEIGENRPRLFNMEGGRHNLVENIIWRIRHIAEKCSYSKRV